ncbi:MAG: HIT domain-containing protein [Nocardioidaceae bacterium]
MCSRSRTPRARARTCPPSDRASGRAGLFAGDPRAAAGNELQVVVDQRHPQPHHRLTKRPSRTNQARSHQASRRPATRHVETFLDLTDEETAQVAIMTRRVATAIRDTFSPNGIHVQQHNGEAAWQTIPHVHFHVIPVDELRGLAARPRKLDRGHTY